MAGNMMAGRNVDIPGTKSAGLATPPAMPRAGDMPGSPGTSQIRDLRGQFAGGWSFEWINLPALVELPQRLAKDMIEARDRAIPRIQEDLVAWAKENAPWNDTTGDAREFLHSPTVTTTKTGDVAIVLAHGVAYGVYLETVNGGQYGVIAKAIDEFAPRVKNYIAAEARR